MNGGNMSWRTYTVKEEVDTTVSAYVKEQIFFILSKCADDIP